MSPLETPAPGGIAQCPPADTDASSGCSMFFRHASDLLAVCCICRDWPNPTLSLGDIRFEFKLRCRQVSRATIQSYLKDIARLARRRVLISPGPGCPSRLAPDAAACLTRVQEILRGLLGEEGV
jgi:hypothetical protein